MENRIGQQLGNYRLSHLLGTGGFGNVYLARHIHLGNQAAIKILTTKMTEDEIEHFRDEARTTMNLQHPNILQVLDFGMQGGIVFIIMRYAPNGTLRNRHPRGTRLSPDTIITYVNQVASALQYAHDQRIIHRDVKPENMLLGRNDEVLLSDFGIATIAHDTISQSTQDSIGTPSYMAPEQVKGRPSPASDQYALGVTVYEWLCGSPPFEGSSTIDIVVQHISVSPPPLHEKIPEISSAVEQVVLKALAKDPQQRFTSVQTFANALEQAVLGQPFDEPIPSTVSTTFEPQWSPPAQSIGTWEGGDVLPGPPTVMVASVVLSSNELKDFFISYNSTNFAWAAWIAQQLEEAGYSTILPPWGLRLDSDFDMEMQKAAAKAKRIVAVLSPAYLNLINIQSTWIETFKQNTTI